VPTSHADHGDDREHRVPQHVRAKHLEFAGSFRTRRPHVFLVECLEHARADHPGVDRREQQREDEPRQEQVVGPLRRAAADRRRAEHLAVAGEGEDVQAVAERVAEHETEPRRVRRHADQDEHHATSV
jgi:hypothetical protein